MQMRAMNGRTTRRWVALTLAIGLFGTGVGVASAKKVDCRTTIAGTYYKAAGGLYNLSADGTITGNLSETSQERAGQGDTFLGMWRGEGPPADGPAFPWGD